jgi:hypothetical protein
MFSAAPVSTLEGMPGSLGSQAVNATANKKLIK